MRTFITLAFAAVASASEQGARFMQFITEFGKNYGTVEEFQVRYEQWAQKDLYIQEHNSSNASASYTLGHNKMSDWADW